MAFTYKINPTNLDEKNGSSHSTSPEWCLTFVRFDKRDIRPSSKLKNAQPSSTDTRDPIVVTSDCINLTVSTNKASHTPAMMAVLKSGSINYSTAVSPGDIVFVNILDGTEKIDKIVEKVKSRKAINTFSDGFKGMFKVQSVRATLQNEPGSGIKQVVYQIQGYACTELNDTIYFIPELVEKHTADGKSSNVFYSQFQISYNSLFGKPGDNNNCQRTLKAFVRAFTGKSISTKTDVPGDNSPNKAYLVPKVACSLMGVSKGKTAADLFSWILGIQTYENSPESTTPPEKGFNPTLNQNDSLRTWECASPITGFTYLRPEYFNQVNVWSILQRFINPLVNEMFASFRVNPDGLIMPTIVLRQKPFSSEKYKGISTKFLNLPRWKIDPSLIYDFNIGKDEIARINFVQIYGMISPEYVSDAAVNAEISKQIASGHSFIADNEDISINGLRPFVQTSSFDAPQSGNKTAPGMAPTWTQLMADILIGGHLKLNGTVLAQGIYDPIAVGDNLELDGVVYHIESINHACAIAPGGMKSFKTTIQLSYGVTTEDGYAQTQNEDIATEQQNDWSVNNSPSSKGRGEKLFPGITSDGSDSISYDVKNNKGEIVKKIPSKPFTRIGR